jgi:hypothetical protein
MSGFVFPSGFGNGDDGQGINRPQGR